MHIANLKNIVTAAMYAALLGVSGVHAETSTLGETAVVTNEAWAFKFTPSYYVTTNEQDATDTSELWPACVLAWPLPARRRV